MLESLSAQYTNFIENKSANMPNIKTLCAEREQFYATAKENQIALPVCKMIEDRQQFVATIAKPLFKISMSNPEYSDLISMLTNSYPCEQFISNQEMIEILNIDEQILKSALKKFKSKPNSAGAKIAILKNALKEIDNKKASLINQPETI